MELKKRCQSHHQFRIAHEKAMSRLRSLTKFNGVLQNCENTLSKLNDKKDQKSKLRNLSGGQKQMKTQPNSKLPVLVNRLKIGDVKNIRKYQQSEGFVEFQIDHKQRNSLLCSTISKNGIILTQKKFVQFITVPQIEQRCKALQKLKQIQTIKYLSILRPFIKWKKYSKKKRYLLLLQNLKQKLNMTYLHEMQSIHSQLVTYFQIHKYVYQERLFIQFNILNHTTTSTRNKANGDDVNILKEALRLLNRFYEDVVRENKDKIKLSLNILPEFKIYSKSLSFIYQHACQQFSIQAVDLLYQTIKKQYKNYTYSPRDYSLILESYKQIMMGNIMIPVQLQFSESSHLKVVSKHNHLFYPPPSQPRIKKAIHSNSIYREISQQDDLQSIAQGNKNNISEIILQTWNINQTKNDLLQNRCIKLGDQLTSLAAENFQQFQQFVKYMEEQFQRIERVENIQTTKMDQVQKKLVKVQSLPFTICFGFFLLDIKEIKNTMQAKIRKCWKESCAKLPMNIQDLLLQYEGVANRMQKMMEQEVTSIHQIVDMKRQIDQFTQWKQVNTQRIASIQGMIAFINKINPRISQTFSVRYIHLKQKLSSIMIRQKTFVLSLCWRLKNSRTEKKCLIFGLQEQIERLESIMCKIRSSEKDGQLERMLLQQGFEQNMKQIRVNVLIVDQTLKIENNPTQDVINLNFLEKVKQKIKNLQDEVTLLRNLHNQELDLSKSAQIYLDMNENNTIPNASNPSIDIHPIKKMISQIKREYEKENAHKNVMMRTITGKIEDKVYLFKNIEILKKSFSLSKNNNKYVQMRVRTFYNQEHHIRMNNELQQIQLKMKILDNFSQIIVDSKVKLKQNKILSTVEVTMKDSLFGSLNQGVKVLDQIIEIKKKKIQYMVRISNDNSNWKTLLNDQITKLTEKLKLYEKTVELLKRTQSIRKMYLESQLVGQHKNSQIESQLNQKWKIFINQFESASLDDVLHKLKQYQKIIQEIQQIQTKSQSKMKEMLNKSFASFPMLYMFDKEVALKSIMDPIYFLRYFFHLHSIKFEKQAFHIISLQDELMVITYKQQTNLKKIFGQIEEKIKNTMIQIALQTSVKYKSSIFFQQQYNRIPLQIISFIDRLRLQQEQEKKKNLKFKQYIQNDIDGLASYLTSIKVTRDKLKYRNSQLSVMLLNRIELKDRTEDINQQFACTNFYEEEDKNFYVEIGYLKRRISYQLISSHQNSLVVTIKQACILSHIHQSFDHPKSTLVVPDNYYLQLYAYRTMSYYLQFAFQFHKFHSVVFAALRVKVIVGFSIKQEVNAAMLQRLYCQLLKTYTEQKDKISKIINNQQKRVEWPIFLITCENIKNVKQIKPQIKHFFRNLQPVTPDIRHLFSYVTKSINLQFSQIHKFQGNQSQIIQFCAEMEQILTKFMSQYSKVCLRKTISNQDLLTKIMMKAYRRRYTGKICRTFAQLLEIFNKDILVYLKLSDSQGNNQKISALKPQYQIKIRTNANNKSIQSQVLSSWTQKLIKKYSCICEQQIIEDDYHSMKIQQFKEVFNNNSLLAIVGNRMSGKSFLLSKALSKISEFDIDSIVKLHVTALGNAIWSEQRSCFKDKKYLNFKNLFIIQGSLQHQNFPWLQKMLRSKKLYYTSGLPIALAPKSKIILQINDFMSLDPYILVQLDWVYISDQQLKWQYILQNRVDKLMEQVHEHLKQAQIKVNQEQVMRQIKNGVQIKMQNCLHKIFEVTDPYFRQENNKNKLIVDLFKLLQTMTSQISRIFRRAVHFKQCDDKMECIDKIEAQLLYFFKYCLTMVLYYSTLKDAKRYLNAINIYFQQFGHTSWNETITNFLPSIVQQNSTFVFTLQHPDICNYYALSSCLNLVPNFQFAVQSKLINNLLMNKNSVIITGSQCSGKSTFIKALECYKLMQPISFYLPEGYNNLIAKIVQRQNLRSQISKKCKIGNENLTVYIDDLNLQQIFNRDVCANLKYLQETKNIIRQISIQKVGNLNFVIQHHQQQQKIGQLCQLYRFTTLSKSASESIYNSLLSTVLKNSPKHKGECINLYQHSCLMSMLTMLQQLNYIFQPNRLQAWKTKYNNQIISEAIQILETKLTSNGHSNQYRLFGTDDASKLFREIHSIVVQLVHSQLCGEDLTLFQKFVSHFTFQSQGQRAKKILQIFCPAQIQMQEHTRVNISKILQAIQLRDIVFIERRQGDQDQQVKNIVEWAIKLNSNYEYYRPNQEFQNFTMFLNYCYDQIKKNENREQKKYIFNIPKQISRINEYVIIDYLCEFLHMKQYDKDNMLLPKIKFILEYEYDNSSSGHHFISKVLIKNKIRVKSLFINFKAISVDCLFQRIQKQLQFDSLVVNKASIMTKIKAIIVSLKNKLQKVQQANNKNNATSKSQYFYKYASSCISKLCKHLLPNHAIQNIVTQIIGIYSQQLSEIHRKKESLRKSIKQIQRIIDEYQSIKARSRNIGNQINNYKSSIEKNKSDLSKIQASISSLYKSKISIQEQNAAKNSKQFASSHKNESSGLKQFQKWCKNALRSITRTQISELKFICTTSKEIPPQLVPVVQAFCLTLIGQYSVVLSNKLLMDIKLSLKIKKVEFHDRSQECLQQICDKTKDALQRIEQIHIFKHIVEWMHYGSKIQIIRRENVKQSSETKVQQTSTISIEKQNQLEDIQDIRDVIQEDGEDKQSQLDNKILEFEVQRDLKSNQIEQLQIELQFLQNERSEVQTILKNIQNFQQFFLLNKYAEHLISQYQADRNGLLASVAYNVLAMQILPRFSLHLKSYINDSIVELIKQNLQNVQQSSLKINLCYWQQYNEISSRYLINSYKCSGNFSLSENEKLKLYSVICTVAKEEKLLIINRKNNFQKLLEDVRNNQLIQFNSQLQERVLCSTAEINEVQWNKLKIGNQSVQKVKASINELKNYQIVLTNSLANFDLRVGSNIDENVERTIVDFGTDRDDIRHEVQKVIMKIYNNKVQEKSDFRAQLETHKIIQQIGVQLSDLSIKSFENINNILKKIGSCKKKFPKKMNSMSTDEIKEKETISSQMDMVNKFVDLYESYEYAFIASSSKNTSQLHSNINAPENFIPYFLQASQQVFSENQIQPTFKANMIYSKLLNRLLATKIGSFFRITYFFRTYAKQVYKSSDRDTHNFFNYTPLDVRFKKLLSSDHNIINMNLNSWKADFNNLQIVRLNDVMKLTIIKSFETEKLSAIMLEQLHKVDKSIMKRPDFQNNQLQSFEDTFCFYICHCDVLFWSCIFGFQANSYKQESIPGLDIYIYSQHARILDLAFHSRKIKVILVSKEKEASDHLYRQLQTHKFVYFQIRLQNLLANFYQIATKSQAFQYFENAVREIKNKQQWSYIEKYLQFKRYQKCAKMLESRILGLSYGEMVENLEESNQSSLVVEQIEQQLVELTKQFYRDLKQVEAIGEMESKGEQMRKLMSELKMMECCGNILTVKSIKQLTENLRIYLNNFGDGSKKGEEILPIVRDKFEQLRIKHFSQNWSHKQSIKFLLEPSQLSEQLQQIYQSVKVAVYSSRAQQQGIKAQSKYLQSQLEQTSIKNTKQEGGCGCECEQQQKMRKRKNRKSRKSNKDNKVEEQTKKEELNINLLVKCILQNNPQCRLHSNVVA